MNFLALLPLFQTLANRLFPDKEKADAAKAEMQKILNQAQADADKAEAAKMESQSKVIVAEAQGQSYAARNWRPHLMYTLMLIVSYNWLAAGLLRSFGIPVEIMPVPSEIWTLLSIGLGGYIGKDVVSSYSNAKFNNDKFFAHMRQLFPKGMSTDQVNVINESLKEAKEV